MASQYAALLSPEHQVTVITPRYHPGMTFMKTPGFIVEPKRPLLAWGKAAWFSSLINMLKQYEAVHLHYPFFGVHERLAKLPERIKLVLTYHMWPQAPGWRGRLMQTSLHYSDKRLGKRANAMTIATQDYLQNVAWPRMGESDKWHILPFGVDDRFSPGEEPERLVRRFNVRFGEKVILFVATLDKAHAFKGLPVLLKALAQVKSDNWKLIVVGGGDWRARYTKQSRQLKLGKRVAFAGYVPTAELPDYYRLAQMFVLPSLNEAEAFGLVALEAMASGLPVIASRLPGVRELVVQGETGWLVKPGDEMALAAAIESLLSSDQERARLGEQALKKVQLNYRWQVVGHKLLEIYRGL